MFLVLIFALALDLLGEPPLLIHPVVWTGRLAEKLTLPFKGVIYGIFLWLASVLPPLLLLTLPYALQIPLLLKLVLAVYTLKTTFSVSMLYRLVKGSVGRDAKLNAQQLVRRNLKDEDDGHVLSAAIESLFESTVDGITSPLFWFLILGIPGALLQRLANTMDSMVGYKTVELAREGWFSAKVDTVLNYIPARITFLFMLVAGSILHMDVRSCVKLVSSSKIESPNARYPIACSAGLLRVKLEKRGNYVENPDLELPNAEDLRQALKLFKVTLFLFLAFTLCIDYGLYGLSLLGHPYGVLELV